VYFYFDLLEYLVFTIFEAFILLLLNDVIVVHLDLYMTS